MSRQLEATAGAVLHVAVTHMLYRVTEEVLHQVYNVYGADSVVVFARAGYVEALVGFLSGGDAEQARDTTHGRSTTIVVCWMFCSCRWPLMTAIQHHLAIQCHVDM
ncbi:hypothetical protein SEVIR_3G181800v4 [Setaria viridis]|uniref:PTBP1-like RNA recognition motif 2 domain-containing protein n=1 Tax=Setaria viridis TaxID=4556 RepID=A0A4U6VAI2_SETVI|nr:hypothetical protein SEVIR_3G181800v2 [Setaria viridis]